MSDSELWPTPLHLLKPDENLHLQVVPETLQALSAIQGPVVLVTVVGTQRGGKSTLLNLLHSRQTAGFGVGHYLDAQTTGLWIWARKHPRNPDLTIVLMDTEGLDTPGIPAWYNWTLSAIAILISSYFIYQTKGHIDSHSTQRLAVILKVAEQLRGNRRDAETDLPTFLWLIRDHHLKMTTAPKQEMVSKLGQTEVAALERCFAAHDCFPLPRPVDKESDLQNVEQMEFSSLKEDFKEEYLVLERQIFTAVSQARRLTGRTVTGSTLADLAKLYTEAIGKQDGVVSDLTALPTQWQMVAQMSGERALKNALKDYETKVAAASKNLPLSQNALAETHNNAYDECLKIFLNEAQIDSMEELTPDLKPFLKKLNDQIATWQDVPVARDGAAIVEKRLTGGAYAALWDKNYTMSQEKLLGATQRLQANLIDSNTETQTDENALLTAQTNALNQFDADVSLNGLVGREQIRSQWVQQQNAAKAVLATKVTRQQATKAVESAVEEFEKSIATAKESMTTQFGSVLQTKLDSLNADLTQRLGASEQTFRDAQTAAQTLSSERHETVQRRLDTVEQSAERLGTKCEAVDAAVAAASASTESKFKQMSDDVAQLQSALDKAQQDNSAALLAAKAEMDASVAEKTAALLEQLRTDLDAKVQALQVGSESTSQQLAQLTTQISQQSERVDNIVENKLSELKRELQEKMTALEAEQLNLKDSTLSNVQTTIDQATQSMETLRSVVDEEKSTREASLNALKESLTQTRAEERKLLKTELLDQQTTELDQLKGVLQQEQHAAMEAGGDVQASLSAQKAALEKAQKELAEQRKLVAQQRGAVDALWESLGQMASRIVGVESAVDETKAISSSKTMVEPKNKQKAAQWLDSFRERIQGSATPVEPNPSQ